MPAQAVIQMRQYKGKTSMRAVDNKMMIYLLRVAILTVLLFAWAPTGIASSEAPSSGLRIFYGGGVEGYVEPCG